MLFSWFCKNTTPILTWFNFFPTSTILFSNPRFTIHYDFNSIRYIFEFVILASLPESELAPHLERFTTIYFSCFLPNFLTNTLFFSTNLQNFYILLLNDFSSKETFVFKLTPPSSEMKIHSSQIFTYTQMKILIVGASHQQAKNVDFEHAGWETRT